MTSACNFLRKCHTYHSLQSRNPTVHLSWRSNTSKLLYFITFKLKLQPNSFPDPETNEKAKCCLYLKYKPFWEYFFFTSFFVKNYLFLFFFFNSNSLSFWQLNKYRFSLFSFYVFILRLTAWLVYFLVFLGQNI